jgi:hypothetical protein
VAPTTTVAVAAPPDVPPPDANDQPPDVAAFVASTPGPGDVSATGAVVITNVLLTMLLLLFFGTTSSVFNNTVDANRLVFEGWGRKLRHRLRELVPIETGWRLSPRRRMMLILGLTAVVYGFLSPGFGFDRASLFLLLALVAGIGVLTSVSEGGAVWFSGHRLGVAAGLRVHGGALLAAVTCVLVSRALGFQPGIVYGFIASAVVLGSFALDRRQAGEFAFYPAAAVLGIGVAAWAALGWVRGGGLGGEAGDLAESGLAVLSVGGIEGVMFSMVPLAFMDGRAVIEWNRWAWAVLAGAATFLFWQLLVNPNLAYLDAFRESGVKLVLAVAAGFAGVTAATWLYFRMRPASSHPVG